MKRKITIEYQIEVEFDENSEAFKNLFENYNEHFRDCDIEEFSEIIAKRILINGFQEPIEGIGLVKVNGEMQNEIDHPINVEVEIDGCDELYISSIINEHSI